MQKLKVGELYEVIWNDAYGQQGWQTPDVIEGADGYSCKTVGYYVGRNKIGDLVFAGTHSDGSYNCIQGRPRAMIKDIRELKAGKRVYKSRSL